ncbi:hypothetical protein [Flavilitoribacter nigricans]|uniref:Uncharacterized protein n=1 Tax=Flavilitoribacter nigricans (strain ATCC 23147 / DSM 23189 / NBRC 102662 / NCIMB 1420 / SS-2) TaxID=1122177 RepID=A0A2D0N835_FLAN2|nr:hypothetical protein [Flavilitoribacter nigricans]PHN04672.1 hypothetical protein CRP01_19325 [Flavilitoribacter nigricans DSM 23189 = NBRC 102662]
MKFVSEEVIDRVAEELGESEAVFETALNDLETSQPVLLAYLFSENFSLFTNQEREFLLFLVIVIYRSAKKVNGDLPRIEEDELSGQEENNWQLLQGVKGHKFHERLDVFFRDQPQEDLLAFAEDALSDVEDGYVTKEGREAIFVAVKSIIDCWR